MRHVNRQAGQPSRILRNMLLLCSLWSCFSHAEPLPPLDSGTVGSESERYARTNFVEAEQLYRAQPDSAEAAWQFARACFDLGEFADSSQTRAEMANRGISAAKEAIAKATNSAPAHYYFAMNLGQLARTKALGALKLVSQMRVEFGLAVSLDPRFDYAGPHRNLGVLYRDAPSIGSVGDRRLARTNLERAVKLVPDYPENRLALTEGYLKWGDSSAASRELNALEALWPEAQQRFTGLPWKASWADWERRLREVKKKIERASTQR